VIDAIVPFFPEKGRLSMKFLAVFACLFTVLAAFPSKSAVLVQENFEDTNFSSRGWYDAPRATLSQVEHVAGSTKCFECFFKTGALGCQGGTPGRHLFAEAETVFVSFWIKYSANYVGSGKPYHPHLFHFVTNKDDKWVGPSFTHLTTYTEQVGGTVRIALQDSRNNDTNCLLLNNGSFLGCNGNYRTYVFTEDRSVCACNGVVGDSGGRDCFNQGDGTYYSARYWDSSNKMFLDQAGPFYKGDWHFIESCFIMNSIANGKGLADGVIQYWYDGKLTIDLHHILFRTGKYPDMKFNQFLIAPYIGDGSPVDQYLWVDNLTISNSRLSASVTRELRQAPAADNAIFLRPQASTGIQITAQCIAEHKASLEITNAAGRAVWKANFIPGKEKSFQAPLPALRSGLYFVLLRQDGKQTEKKVVVIR
jgi:hypothetical protein